MKNKARKFKAIKTPRYLPGQVENIVLTNDLIAFNKHKYNVFSAGPQVDDKPFIMNPNTYVKTARYTQDLVRIREIDKSNKDMVRRINTINRMGGMVDSFNRLAYASSSKWRAQELRMKAIVKYNRLFYNKIDSADDNWDGHPSKLLARQKPCLSLEIFLNNSLQATF